MRKVCVTVLARNERESLPGLLPRIPKELCGMEVETLLVNDGSKDSSEIVGDDCGVNVISLPAVGPSRATREGLRYAYENGCVYHIGMDGDGQHDPGYLEFVIQSLEEGDNLVVSSRFREDSPQVGQIPVDRILLNHQVRCTVQKMTGRDFTDPLCGFRGHDRKMMKFLLDCDYVTDSCPQGYGFPLESLLRAWRASLNIREIPHPAIYNGDGKISRIYGDEFLDHRLERFKLHAHHLLVIARALQLEI